jgi:WD40 repeat protein
MYAQLSQSHLVTGGYDKTVRLFDVNTGSVVKTFTGHQLAVTKTIFNPLGNLVISGLVIKSAPIKKIEY